MSYSKKTWNTGEVIDAQSLNNIEKGIQTNSEAIKNKADSNHTHSEYITEATLNAKNYATETFVTSKIAEASLSGGEVDLTDYVTDSELTTELGKKQDKLVSGTNIKTINGNSLLGSGDITITGGQTSSTVPSYWQSHLDTKIAEVNTLNGTLGSKGASFVFLTDTHYPNNYGKSPALINEITKNTSIKKVFLGGDIIANPGSSTLAVKQCRSFVNSLNNDIELYPMRGNHDTDNGTTENHFWDAMYRNIGRYCEVDGNLYYYSDDKANKIRYIITDSTYSEGNASSKPPSTEQLEWMKERILELKTGWNTLIFTHSIWTGAGSIGTSGQAILDAIDEVYDKAQCTIIGVICGHCHADRSAKFDKGYVAFSTTYDYKGGTAGTTTEQAFDIVSIDLENATIKTTRIGRGNNREFTYKKMVNIPVEGISLDATEMVVGNGYSDTLTAILTPNETSNREVTWEIVSGGEYVTIEPNGLVCNVTGKGLGKATIKVTTVNGGFEATCEVTVVDMMVVDLTEDFKWTDSTQVNYRDGNTSSTSVWKASDFVEVSGFSTLEVGTYSTGSSGATAGYAFYDADKRYITGKQVVVGTGYAYVKRVLEVPTNAVYFRTSWYRSANISEFTCIGKGISVEPTGVSLDVTELALGSNITKTITATVLPKGAKSEVTWSIANGSEFISIEPSGKKCNVTGVAKGTATVKATTTEGFEATCTISITEITEMDITNLFVFSESGGVQYGNGGNSTDSNYNRTDYIDISNYTLLKITMPLVTNASTSMGYAFYNENKAYVSGVKNPHNASWSYGVQELEVPANAKYIRAMWYGTSHPAKISEDKFSCVAIGVSVDTTGIELDAKTHEMAIGRSKILNAKLLPTGANSKVTWEVAFGNLYVSIEPSDKTCKVTANSVGKAVINATTTEGFEATCEITVTEAPSGGDITDQFIWTEGYRLLGTTGTPSSDSNWKVSDYVDVSNYSGLEVTMPVTTVSGTTSGCAFYDSSKKFISGTIVTNGASAMSFDVKNLEIPENAVYFRTMWYSTNHSGYQESFIFNCVAK